ncbi:restriction endonuclease [Helicobacter pylori]|uniref:restriction endonuclease n=1 Tax=Helicobacter pylori TaxID=210 RepID=UPI001F3F68C0|nr:restriction endonuclease [Helicobacter pylori]
MIPTQLNEIAKFLKTNPYNLSQPLQDGRLNSSVNEEEILNTIKHFFPIQLPKAREWWDFSFEENDIFYPVNIKITTTKTADNLNCKFNKNDPKDIFINSLKGIQTLQPNGNNLPFQCKWDNNREIIQRDFDESKNFILSALAESVKLRVYLAFKEFFGEFFASIRH